MRNYTVFTNLTQELHDDGHHSILFGEALVGHVPGGPARADEDLPTGRLEGNVSHVWTHPAVGLAKHGLRSQGRCHQEDFLALESTAETG